MEKVGKKLKQLRQQNEWSQYDVAKQLGISIPSYSKMETGITDISYSRLESIAKLHGITVVQLLQHNEPTEKQPDHTSEMVCCQRQVILLQQRVIELQDKLSGDYHTGPVEQSFFNGKF